MKNRCVKRRPFRFGLRLKRLLIETDGPTATEYAVMLALVLAVVITAVATLGTTVNNEYVEANTALFS